MTMKFWRLKLNGERPMDEIHSAIGLAGGSVLRIHCEGGETHVYFSAEKSAAPGAVMGMKEVAMSEPEEVSADEVTRLG